MSWDTNESRFITTSGNISAGNISAGNISAGNISAGDMREQTTDKTSKEGLMNSECKCEACHRQNYPPKEPGSVISNLNSNTNLSVPVTTKEFSIEGPMSP